MIGEFKSYRLTNIESAMPKVDKQITATRKKASLRQLPNLLECLPRMKEQRPASDSAKVLGAKRRHRESPSSTFKPCAVTNNPGTGHLVYVRRKPDVEGCKLGSCVSVDSASPNSRKSTNGMVKEDELQVRNQSLASPSAASLTPPASIGPYLGTLGKPTRNLVLPDMKDATVISTKPFHVEPKNLDCQNYWKERFHRLQIFLENCDQSNQEDYIQMLRSLSAIGRSKHAVELEKRAIQLLLEEGKELHRMRVLNILGKALPNDHPPISSTPAVLSVPVEFPKVNEGVAGQ